MGHDFLAVCLCFLVLFDCDVDGETKCGELKNGRRRRRGATVDVALGSLRFIQMRLCFDDE